VLENFALDEMMNELVDIVGHQASRNQVEMILDVCPSLCGVVVRGDKFRLRCVFPTEHVPPLRLPILVLRRDGYYLCPDCLLIHITRG
jgi:hypothetical protein